ncbi:hypothetical protein FPZ42_17200 [Mucilaginibacter achroorhodeus]|uniref:DUF4382 domain-containing protein n=1 Tax=Mucilaginibacter achroorhodeus TaxID=2599294 RepID=A0A563U033_9SPHI|nr:hypothetical protein [Mucilaginibacter achroorhodeus]TWR24221.1 hypothetical protein FPZ42_17200 [Mucilaginibacter achroorhodeus]
MKKNLLNLGVAALVCTALFSSCSKEKNASTAAAQTEMGFQLTADNQQTTVGTNAVTDGREVNATAISTASIKWTSVIANVSRFKLEAKRNGKVTEITTKNVSNLDLLNLNSSPITALVDTGHYREIEVKILLVKSSGTDIPLTAKGTFTTAAGAAVPIEFDYNDNAIIKGELKDVTVDANTGVTSKINLHLNKLLTGIPSTMLDQATRTNGTIVINSTTNAAIYNRVIINIFLAFEAHEFEHHKK